MFALMGIQLPRSFQVCMEERTGNDALSKQTAFSVFPPLADGRNTAGKQLFKIGSVLAVCQLY